MKQSLYIIYVIIFTCLNSCSSEEESNSNLSRIDIELTRSQEETAQNLYEFPVNLLMATYEANGKDNTMISPLSVELTLGMLTNALDFKERDKILGILNLREDALDDYNDYMSRLLEELPNLDSSTIFTLDNGFWLTLNSAYSLNADYETLLKDLYKAEINRFDNYIDYDIVKRINSWIADKTGMAIPGLLNLEDATLKLNYLWANALYFKGQWTQKFSKEKTVEASFYPFYPDTSIKDNVSLMFGNEFRYCYYFYYDSETGKNEDLISTVMLPFRNESFVFTAILPSENNPDVFETLKRLDAGFWKKIDEKLSVKKKDGNLIVYLPKINYRQTNDFKPVLENMAGESIFDNLSMIHGMGAENQELNLIRQTVVLDLDEEGAEISAATVGSGLLGASPSLVVKFDRPFIYFVRERSTGTMLLAGIYMHP